jgi:hypothetical protein
MLGVGGSVTVLQAPSYCESTITGGIYHDMLENYFFQQIEDLEKLGILSFLRRMEHLLIFASP